MNSLRSALTPVLAELPESLEAGEGRIQSSTELSFHIEVYSLSGWYKISVRSQKPPVRSAVPAYNLPGGQVFHPKGEGNGYVLSFGGQRCYVAGDTSAIPEMAALKDISVAFLPMNQPYTMTPEEAAAAARSFMPTILYPYHSRGSDTAALGKALEGSGIEVRLRDWYY